MLLGVQHSGFVTKQIDKIYEFYTKLPGVRVIMDMCIMDNYIMKELTGYKNAKVRMFWIQIGKDEIKHLGDSTTARLEFIEYLEPLGEAFDLQTNTAGNAHVSIFTDSIEDDYERLSKEGVKFSGKPIIVNAEGDLNGVKVVYCYDPEGRTIELMEFPK